MKITLYISFVFSIVFSFSQERKIEKFVLSNFNEGKLNFALQELENLKEKYEEKAFFSYWKAYIFTEKLKRFKNTDWDENNRAECIYLIESSQKLIDQSLSKLTPDQLNIDQDEFNILFHGCSIYPPNGEKKFTNCSELLKQKFNEIKNNLNELNYNLSLVSMINQRINEKRELEDLLNSIRNKVTTSYYAHPLRGEITKELFLKVASTRNELELKKMENDNTDYNWLNYLKKNTSEEYQSIVPQLETLINNYHLEGLQKRYNLLKNNVYKLPDLISELENTVNQLDINSSKYFNEVYGNINFSKSFKELRKSNFFNVINQAKIQQSENQSRQKKFVEELEYNQDLIIENFDNNSNNWNECDHQNAFCKISNGNLKFENRFGGSYTVLSDLNIPSNIDKFYITVNTKWVKGIDNNSINLVWGAKSGESTYYSFGISANGNYRHMSSVNGVLTDIITWKYSKHINKLGENIISIRRDGTKIEFYINFFKVDEANFSDFFGNQIGMTIHGKQFIEYDNLQFKYNTIEEIDSFEIESNIEQTMDDNNSEPIKETKVFKDGPGPGVVDIDGNKYKTVYIGNKEWFAENLRVTKYNDGIKIPNITTKINKNNIVSSWGDKVKECWCFYGDNPANNLKLGKLYTAYVVKNSKNICPVGWHVSTNEDWWEMIDYLGGNKVAGNKLKSKTGWSENYGTNTSGFNALPGGERVIDSFEEQKNIGYWWTSPDEDSDVMHNNFEIYWNEKDSYNFQLGYNVENIKSDAHFNELGFSIRCVKN